MNRKVAAVVLNLGKVKSGTIKYWI